MRRTTIRCRRSCTRGTRVRPIGLPAQPSTYHAECVKGAVVADPFAVFGAEEGVVGREQSRSGVPALP